MLHLQLTGADSTAYDEIVTIIAGNKPARIYKIHKGVLTFYSGYFAKALNGSFAEAAKMEVKLPDSESRVFDAVQNWLYSHQLHPANETDVKEMDFASIAKIWVFGDAHDMPALQNAAVDLFHRAVLEQWIVPTGCLTWIYTNTVPSARLRLYCIDLISKSSNTVSVLKTNSEVLFPKRRSRGHPEDRLDRDPCHSAQGGRAHVGLVSVSCSPRECQVREEGRVIQNRVI